jgi:hypothetical protein
LLAGHGKLHSDMQPKASATQRKVGGGWFPSLISVPNPGRVRQMIESSSLQALGLHK